MQIKKLRRIITTIYCSTFDMWNLPGLIRCFLNICICLKKKSFLFFILFEDVSKLDILSRPFHSKAEMQSLLGL